VRWKFKKSVDAMFENKELFSGGGDKAAIGGETIEDSTLLSKLSLASVDGEGVSAQLLLLILMGFFFI
jgi:hypothetical protein